MKKTIKHFSRKGAKGQRSPNRSLILSCILLSCFISTSCMKLDSFLFNSEELDEYSLPGNTIPESLIEEVMLDSDGNTLHGFWVGSNGDRSGLTILYCHGNKHNIDHYWDRVMFLHDFGVNLFIYDYRGFGKSDGESSEDGLYSDGTAALDYVLSRNEVTADSLIVYGFSLGNVVSIYLTAEKIDPLCLFAEALFAAATSLTQGSSIIDVPHRWLTEGEFNNAERIKNIHVPFMIFHGDEDDFVRYRDNGKIVYENAPEPKRLVLIPGAGHTDIPQRLGLTEYYDTMNDWISFSISH
ncbi:MAG: alpha/beta hydrolase [Candidatus Electryonea clarkiae]|nr:alpha/beta hydrolase [Candidatus Electryonea clarkiae]MDP8285559.1 alpha/beta hydrolase [Candidatus Electryonea clarkiae]